MAAEKKKRKKKERKKMVLGIDIYKKKKFREVTDIVCVRA